MKTHKSIALRFCVGGGINPLCVDWAHVSLVLYFSGNHLSKDPLVSGILLGKSSVSLSSILSKNDKVDHHIRMKTHKLIVLRF